MRFQDENGLWNKGLYNGKLLSTTYSLYLLKLLGLPSHNSQALKGCNQLITQGIYQNSEIRFSSSQKNQDLGVTAIVLSLCCYFRSQIGTIPNIASFLVNQQSDEGSWLPNESPSAAAYKFVTTLLVLEAIMQYQNHSPAEENLQLSEIVLKGHDFLLANNLGFGEMNPIKSQWSTFSFPPYWFYDMLTVLDYFCCFHSNKDRRIQTAINFLQHKKNEKSTWLLGAVHPGKHTLKWKNLAIQADGIH